jgi:hypothetical protein
VKTVTYVEIDIPDFKNDRQAGFLGDPHLVRGADLTGNGNSKQATFSTWVYLNEGFGGRLLAAVNSLGGDGGTTRFVLSSGSNSFSVVGANVAGATIVNFESSVIPFGEWTHIMTSFDLSDTAKRHLYVNGEEDLQTIAVYTDDTIDFTQPDWGIGAYPGHGNLLNGALADLWFQPGVYIDLSDANNRRLFLQPDGNPVNMGSDGSHVTGSPPLVFMTGDAASWPTNKGTGGGFSLGQYSDLTEFEAPTRTYRFAMPADYLDETIEAIPSIDAVSFTPARISLGDDLGQRASLRVNLRDHLHVFNGEDYNAGTFFGKWRGRYGTKLRGRRLRLIRGLVGQALTDMDTRHYLIEQTDGPTFDGVYTIEAKDVLKFADDDRARAPVVSVGTLSGSINAVVTAASLSPAGVGDELYPASGYLTIGGKEVVSYTRVNDALTMVRGQFGSVAQAHTAGDRIQITLRYDGDDVADIIYDLLVNYAAVPAAYINLPEWQTETADNLGVIYAATITEPTSVKTLVSELVEQAALALWWDDRAQLIRLNVLREIATDTDHFDHERIIQGSLNVKEQPLKRISQIWTFYGERDPTDRGAKEDNYRAVLTDVDLEREAEYGSPEIRQIMARWLETETAASRLNGIQLSRFRDPPRLFSFDLVRGEMVTPAAGYTIQWWGSQDETGVEVPVKIQITQVAIHSDRIHIEAEEMLASGVINLVNVVFLTTTGAVLSYVVDASWNNADNSIHTIGAGGGGASGLFAGGGGGGGGAYSAVTNVTLTPGGSVSYRVGTGGDGAAGGDTWFNGASLAASTVGAKGGAVGTAGSGGAGGVAADGIGSTKTSGGDGGDVASSGGSNGGGGGGAAGPNGNGANGGNGSTNFDAGGGGGGADDGDNGSNGTSSGGGAGGNNRNNFGGGNSGTPTGDEGGGGAGGGDPSGAGGTGEQIWTQTVSPIISAGPGGGGGGGAGNSGAGSNGGLYGGGGGGCGNAGSRGDGAQGVIVLIWREAI